MRNNVFSLILGLIVILTAPALTSCGFAAKKESKKIEQPAQGLTADVQTLVYHAPVAQCRDVVFSAVQDSAATPDSVATEPGSSVSDYLTWQNIISLVLSVVAALFATFWNRARNVINAIAKGLEDGTLSKDEISGIVKAWKNK